MRRWLVIVLGILLFCVVAGAVGARYAVNRFQDELSEPLVTSIALSVENSVSQAIGFQSQSTSVSKLRLWENDLDINTVVGPPGESGLEVTAAGDESVVLIYGATSTIDVSGISVALADMTYHAIPIVIEGRIELENSTTSKGISGWIFDSEAIEQGFETGLNDALAASDLVPVEIELRTGQMTITVSPVS